MQGHYKAPTALKLPSQRGGRARCYKRLEVCAAIGFGQYEHKVRKLKREGFQDKPNQEAAEEKRKKLQEYLDAQTRLRFTKIRQEHPGEDMEWPLIDDSKYVQPKKAQKLPPVLHSVSGLKHGRVPQPQRIFNGGNLAYLGDAVWEVYVRKLKMLPYHQQIKYAVNIDSASNAIHQAYYAKKLRDTDFITLEEYQVLKWGFNFDITFKRTKLPEDTIRHASSLETLVGYLFLKDPMRLHAVMLFLGMGGITQTMMIGKKRRYGMIDPNAVLDLKRRSYRYFQPKVHARWLVSKKLHGTHHVADYNAERILEKERNRRIVAEHRRRARGVGAVVSASKKRSQ